MRKFYSNRNNNNQNNNINCTFQYQSVYIFLNIVRNLLYLSSSYIYSLLHWVFFNRLVCLLVPNFFRSFACSYSLALSLHLYRFDFSSWDLISSFPSFILFLQSEMFSILILIWFFKVTRFVLVVTRQPKEKRQKIWCKIFTIWSKATN